LGLRIFEATSSSIEDLGEEHGHRVLRVHGKGDNVVLVPLPPAEGRAIERAVDDRADGPILRTRTGSRMDRHAATRRLPRVTEVTGMRIARMHPHMQAARTRDPNLRLRQRSRDSAQPRERPWHQLAEDVGTAESPRLQLTRIGPTPVEIPGAGVKANASLRARLGSGSTSGQNS
jgi:hypothetical protein